MNKEEFLKKLDKKLAVLSEKERKDIIDEYRDTISEKVKHGQSEKDAVKDFGDIDELSKEILQAYKLDPNYNDKSSFDKLMDDGEDLIKKGADKLAKTSKDIADGIKSNNSNITLSFVFEVIIRLFIGICLCVVMKIPFNLIESIGYNIFDQVPFNHFFNGLYDALLMVLYIVLCAFMFIALFKDFLSDNLNSSSDIKETHDKKNNEKEEKNAKKNDNKEVKSSNNLGNMLSTVFILLIKIWVVIIILVPAVFILFGILFGLVLSVIYLFKGINLYGLVILLIGLAMMCGWFIKVIYNMLFRNKNESIIPFFISIVITVVGSVLFAVMLFDIDYIDEMPKNIKFKEETFNYQTTEKVDISGNVNVTKTVDNSMAPGEYKVKVKYFDKLGNLIVNDDKVPDLDEEGNTIPDSSYNVKHFYVLDSGVNNFKVFYDLFINNLKKNRVYNYDELYNINVEVIGNEQTLALINGGE